MGVIHINKNPSKSELRWFGVLLFGFTVVLGGLSIWKGQALLHIAVVIGSAWLISLLFNAEDRSTQLLGVILPFLCVAIGGPIKAGAAPLVVATVVWSAGLLLGIGTLLSTRFAMAVYVKWMLAAVPISWTISHLMLAAVYYLMITPISLVMRLLGRDSLSRKFDPDAKTYWSRRNPRVDIPRYFRQF